MMRSWSSSRGLWLRLRDALFEGPLPGKHNFTGVTASSQCSLGKVVEKCARKQQKQMMHSASSSSWNRSCNDRNTLLHVSLGAGLLLSMADASSGRTGRIVHAEKDEEHGGEGECQECVGEVVKETNPADKHATAKWRVFTDRARDLHQQGRVEEAREFFRRALVEAEKGFGPDDEHLAASYQNLAELLRINGELDEAEELYLKAIGLLEMKSKMKPEQEAEKFEGSSFVSAPIRAKALATTVDRLCGLYLHMRPKKLKVSRDCYRKALRLKIAAFGGDHIEVANTLANAAQVSRLEGDQKDAIDLLGQSLDCLLRNQGNEDESGQMILHESLKLFRGRSLQLAHLLLKQGSQKERSDAEDVLRRLIKLTMHSMQDEDDSASEEDIVRKDLQVCNLFCQALVQSGNGSKCQKALTFLKHTRDHIMEVNAGRKGSLQQDLLECAVNRQLAEAHLCVASHASPESRKEILKEIELLDIEKRQIVVEHWWTDLQAKEGLRSRRLLPSVSLEFLFYLKLEADIEKELGLVPNLAKLEQVLDSLERMQISESSKEEIRRVALFIKDKVVNLDD